MNAPDPLTALCKVIEMEEHVAHLHVQSSLSYKDDSMQKMFAALGQADKVHIESLQQYVTILSLPQSEMRG